MEELKQVWLNNNILKPGEPLHSFQIYKHSMGFSPPHTWTCIHFFLISGHTDMQYESTQSV